MEFASRGLDVSDTYDTYNKYGSNMIARRSFLRKDQVKLRGEGSPREQEEEDEGGRGFRSCINGNG